MVPGNQPPQIMGNNAPQQRMQMRPVMSSNPGLRHLLQQVYYIIMFIMYVIYKTYLINKKKLFSATSIQAANDGNATSSCCSS